MKTKLLEVVTPPYIYHIPFYCPKRHGPPTNPKNDTNISPVEGSIFAVNQSMQNVQKLSGTGGCDKYLCKDIENVDNQNYVIIEVDGEGRLVSKYKSLQNKIFLLLKLLKINNEGKMLINHREGASVSWR